ncbi:conjugal transfer protein TraF [Lelliottia nimipressuralis]|uniref:conjugal transfer protein TraF n=1 Tax=Lelliottia nimipressuralis TaxID=69220 RepID=UPI003D2D9C72
MKKHFKFSVVSIAVSLFMANEAGAANTWTEARSDAMGGTGVASGNYGSGAFINPALLAKAKPDDDITVILPSSAHRLPTKIICRIRIDDISDKVDYYDDVINSLTAAEIIANPLDPLTSFRVPRKISLTSWTI